jgi:hypothetical protein
MAEDSPLLHIDTDWKKQAQEEKRKLAELAAAKAAAPATPPAPAAGLSTAAAPARSGRRSAAEPPAASFPALVQSVLTQVLYYLGDLASATGQQRVDVDMAKYQLDLMTMLEEKTKNNLSPDEVGLLDAALYEGRTRFVNVASQLLGP